MSNAVDYGYNESLEIGHSNASVFVDKINKRLRLTGYSGDLNEIAPALAEMAQKLALGKVIIFAPQQDSADLESSGYGCEGKITAYFRGETAYVYTLFTDPRRKQSGYRQQEAELLNTIKHSQPAARNSDLGDLQIRTAGEEDIEKLLQLYSRTFKSYPSPLMEKAYMQQIMRRNVVFICAFNGNQPVSSASLEMDLENANAELTDCATLSQYRGRGLLQEIMNRLEDRAREIGLVVLYSLARAGSYGMNASLHKLGYNFEGKLVNNCHIGGRYENMNIWVKPL